MRTSECGRCTAFAPEQELVSFGVFVSYAGPGEATQLLCGMQGKVGWTVCVFICRRRWAGVVIDVGHGVLL